MKTCNTKINAFLNKSKITKDGTCNVNIILSATVAGNRIIKKLFTGYNVKPEFWDTDKHQINNSVKGAVLANREIKKIIDKLEDIRFDLEYQNKLATPDLILEVYKNDNYDSENTDFIAFCKKELEDTRKDFSKNHYDGMIVNLDNLIKYTNGNLPFEKITLQFLDRYRYWMEHENGNKQNTVYQRLSQIRKFLNVAVKNGVTTIYPFKNYKFKAEKVDKEFLELKEVEILHKLYYDENLPERLKITLHYFLLSCYTGLRLGDIRRVTKDTIKDNKIVLNTQKTGTKVMIPLNKAALNLLNFDLEGIELFERTIKISYSRISNDLNEILEHAKIKGKKITFHCSRHTFAINSLVLGIPIVVVSKILGHTDLKTTQIYAKVVDSLLSKEMDKWNDISFTKS